MRGSITRPTIVGHVIWQPPCYECIQAVVKSQYPANRAPIPSSPTSLHQRRVRCTASHTPHPIRCAYRNVISLNTAFVPHSASVGSATLIVISLPEHHPPATTAGTSKTHATRHEHRRHPTSGQPVSVCVTREQRRAIVLLCENRFSLRTRPKRPGSWGRSATPTWPKRRALTQERDGIARSRHTCFVSAAMPLVKSIFVSEEVRRQTLEKKRASATVAEPRANRSPDYDRTICRCFMLWRWLLHDDVGGTGP